MGAPGLGRSFLFSRLRNYIWFQLNKPDDVRCQITQATEAGTELSALLLLLFIRSL